MASAVPATGEVVSVSRVFSRAFAVITSNPATVFGVAFVFGALPSVLLGWYMQSIRGALVNDYARLGYGALTLVSALVGIVLAALVQGALVEATVAYTERRKASFGESAAAGLSAALPLVGLAILMGIAVGFGLMLFLIPGIILYVMWSVASPALVAERTGVFGAFSRSRQLTKGARWKVLGVELIVVLMWWAISGVIGALVFTTFGINGVRGFAEHGLPIGWLIGNAVLSTLINAFWSTTQTSLYVELRNWKDGHSGQALEDIFA
ncbi:MAG: YciC family protein [Sphingomonas sp.]